MAKRNARALPRYLGMGLGVGAVFAMLCAILVQDMRSVDFGSSFLHHLKEYWHLARASRIARTPFVLLAASLGSASPAYSSAGVRAVPPTKIGMNLTGVSWYSGDRVFANLALGGYWQLGVVGQGWADFPATSLNPDGSLRSLPEGGAANRMLVQPDTGPQGATIRCTYAGKGRMTARGSARDVVAFVNGIQFRWTNLWANNNVWLEVSSIDPADPIRAIDCREQTMAKDARFDPAFVKSLGEYKILRFMDWQRTNANMPVTWATRHTPASFDIAEGDGVSLEDIAALTTAVGADPWVTVPWNADDDYIQRFARYMYTHLPADRTVYVELSNEVWNGGFPVAKQAMKEGIERGLSANPNEAKLLRYAQRSNEVMKIWEGVFAADPKRLVRIVSTQNVLPGTAETVLGFGDTACHVDALATAPYFGYDVMGAGQTSDLTEIFRRLNILADEAVQSAVANKAVATRYGKRYLAYEAGQHVVLPADLPLLTAIQRDPRMYDTYKRYIHGWKAQVGDVLTMFASVSKIGGSGAWGIAEHVGQPLAETPKRRAVIDER